MIFKDCIPYDLVSGVVFKCDICHYGDMEGQLKITSGEHIGMSPLPFKKPPKDTCTFEYDNNPFLISLSFLSFF